MKYILFNSNYSSALKKMIPANIKLFYGFKEIEDLIPEGHLIKYKQIWSVQFEHFLEKTGDLSNRLVLELTKDREVYRIPIIRMIIVNPTDMILCPDQKVIQFSIDDYREDGWERRNFKVYDAEMDSNWEFYCEKIYFERVMQEPDFINNFSEPSI